MPNPFKKKKEIPGKPMPERKAAPQSAKKLEDYAQSEPFQLFLFRVLDLKLADQQRYSNTIELYDFMPKYHWGKVERIGGEFLRVLEREFECKTIKYKIEIAPSVITDSDGVKRYYYPSKREELVRTLCADLPQRKKAFFWTTGQG